MKKLNVNILTGGGGSRLSRSTESRAIHLNPSEWTKSRAFTMAEILLSLTIIGVVAAITLPSLTGNINERTWNTQRKALYARMSQAISLMPALNGYGTYETISSSGSTSVIDTTAEAFVTEGLSKVLKINNICDSEHLQDCGIPANYVTMGASNSSFPKTLDQMNMYLVGGTAEMDFDTKAAAFETPNGESIAVFYNPICTTSDFSASSFVQKKMCVNFVYDLNGSKGPNTVGKDIGFISVLYSSDSEVVAPIPVARIIEGEKTQNDAIKACTALDSESRLPNMHELSAIYFNQFFIGTSAQEVFWSSSKYDSNRGWRLGFNGGSLEAYSRNNEYKVRCIKR